MPPFRLGPVLVVASILTGCTTYRAAPLETQTELDALRQRDLRYFVVEHGRESSVIVDAKFDPSDGLDEDELVVVALTLNPELQAKRAGTGEAAASLIVAGLWPNPQIGVSARPGIDGASGYVLEGDLLFQLLRPGESDAQKKVAGAGLAGVRADLVTEEYRVVADVRQQRLAVLAAERSVALFEEAADLRKLSADLVRKQRQIGEATELASSATELELAESHRDVRKARTELATEMRALNRILGLPPEYPLKLIGFGEPLTVIVLDDISDEELDRRLVAGRPELRAKEAAFEKAEQELRLAVIGQYPRLGLGPAFERELGGEKSLGIGLSLELPLFNRNQGEIAEKQAARDRVRAEYVALLHRLRSDAFSARATVRAAKAEVEGQEKDILPLLRRNQELFEGAYRARELNIVDWITAQERAVNARREYLDALVTYRKAVIEIDVAMGRPLATTTTRPSTRPN